MTIFHVARCNTLTHDIESSLPTLLLLSQVLYVEVNKWRVDQKFHLLLRPNFLNAVCTINTVSAWPEQLCFSNPAT